PHRVARRLDPLRRGRARDDELLERQREELVDERVDVDRLVRAGAPAAARAHDAQRRTPASVVRPVPPVRAASSPANAASVTTGMPYRRAVRAFVESESGSAATRSRVRRVT